MSDFTIANQNTGNMDSHKRVNYEHGMVLGVDEFLQEEIYLLTRDRRHNRSLHGYGTVCGLAVAIADTGTDDRQITVTSGIGINPQGQEIRVPTDQCALLNEWLGNNSEGLPADGTISVDLVLCYRECETDPVPVPSGPCRSLEETMAASRIADDFELKFTTQRPQHVEAQIIRHLFDALNSIEVNDDPTNFSEADLIAYVRSFIEAAGAIGSPPSSPPNSWEIAPPGKFLVGSLPEAAHMNVTDARDLLRLALRVWVTEVRPKLLAGDKNCASGPPDEKCLFLANFTIPVSSNKVGGVVTIDEDNRPYLISTRALQEHLLDRAATPDEIGVTSHGELTDLVSPDDHPQYLRTDGGRVLSGEQSAGNHKITNLALATENQDAVPLGQLSSLLSTHDHAQFLMRDGSRDLQGDLSADGNKITRLGNPSAAGDALSLGFAQQNFVAAVAGPYKIVAGGRFLMESGDPVGPVYNKLTAKPVPDYPEILNLQFEGYQNPTTEAALKKFSYIVKANFEGDGEKIASAVVQVVGYGTRKEGLFIRIVPITPTEPLVSLIKERGAPFPLELSGLTTPGVSIEISEIQV